MFAIASLIDYVITIYIWILVGNAILSWLVAFEVVSPHNRYVRQVGYFLWRVTEPILGPIRRLLPDLGGIDISPLILIVLLIFARNLIVPNLLAMSV